MSRGRGFFLAGLLGAVATLAGVTPSARAGVAWTQEPGSHYAHLALYAIPPYEELFAPSGDAFRTSRKISDVTLEFYGEYGFVDEWTALVAAPLKWLHAGDANADPTLSPTTVQRGSLTALGNLRVGLRRQLVRADWVSAAQVEIEAPTAEFDESTGLRSGYDAWALVTDVGLGRPTRKGYFDSHVGLGLRGNGYADFWTVGLEWGFRSASGRWTWVGALEAVRSLRDGDRVDPLANRQTGLYVDEQEVVSPVIKVFYQATPRWGLQFTVQGGFDGSYVARSPFLGVALFSRS